MTFKIVTFGNVTKELKYKHSQLRILEETGGKKIYGPKFEGSIGWLPVIANLGRPSILAWLIKLGLMKDNPGITDEQVDDLIDAFTDSYEPDLGKKRADLVDEISSALLMGYGLNPLPIIAALRTSKKKPETDPKVDPGTGEKPNESA